MIGIGCHDIMLPFTCHLHDPVYSRIEAYIIDHEIHEVASPFLLTLPGAVLFLPLLIEPSTADIEYRSHHYHADAVRSEVAYIAVSVIDEYLEEFISKSDERSGEEHVQESELSSETVDRNHYPSKKRQCRIFKHMQHYSRPIVKYLGNTSIGCTIPC